MRSRVLQKSEILFRPMNPGMDILDDGNLDEEMREDDDEEGIFELMMENDREIGCAFRDQIVSFVSSTC